MGLKIFERFLWLGLGRVFGGLVRGRGGGGGRLDDYGELLESLGGLRTFGGLMEG